jgi:predicted Zn-dependent protease
MTARSLLVAAITVCMTWLSTGCYQVPVTGRRAVNIVNEKQVTEMSVAEFDKMKSTYPRSRNADHIAALNRVGERISKVVFWDMPHADWEFVVFEVPQQINAFAMAGGKVGVFSGLFKIIKNDDQLASVIAHEIAHVTAKHVHERLSQQMLVEGGSIAGSVAMIGTGVNPVAGSAILGAYDLSTGMQVLAYDREKELEADHIGLIYMARAGYNPEESIRVIEQLEAESAGKPLPPAWLSTHPSNPERLLRLLDAMPKALEIYQQGGRTATPVVVR